MMEKLLHNWPAKVLSVLFALILWFFVTGEQTAEVGFAIPLELKNIPKSMMVVNDLPSLVDVRISGPRTILSSLRPRDLLLSVDMEGSKEGITTFRRLEKGINIPTVLKITRLSPSSLDINIEKIHEKRVPVKVVTKGEPDPGFLVEKMEAIPPRVFITGRAASLKRIDAVPTLPLNIQDARRDISRTLSLDLNDRYASLKDTRNVEVKVTLKEKAQPEPPAEEQTATPGQSDTAEP